MSTLTAVILGAWWFAGCWLLALYTREGLKDVADAVGIAAAYRRTDA